MEYPAGGFLLFFFGQLWIVQLVNNQDDIMVDKKANVELITIIQKQIPVDKSCSKEILTY